VGTVRTFVSTLAREGSKEGSEGNMDDRGTYASPFFVGYYIPLVQQSTHEFLGEYICCEVFGLVPLSLGKERNCPKIQSRMNHPIMAVVNGFTLGWCFFPIHIYICHMLIVECHRCEWFRLRCGEL
jgi:hypothetical protein